MLAYARTVYGLPEATEAVRDTRRKPRIPAGRVVRCLLLVFWVRIGSLHGLVQARPGRRWCQWAGGPVPSEDTLGRVAAGLDAGTVRWLLDDHYSRRKRNKSLQPWPGGLQPLVLDGHELGASYRRCCPKCLTRQVKTKKGERTQYYHRHVAALLLHRRGELLLDVEPVLPGEDEIAAARRLLERLLARHPRAFNVVAGDALYLHPGLCQFLRDHGKDFIAVLKNENRDLLADARGLFAPMAPATWRKGTTSYQAWDAEGFTTWTQFGHPVRVVRSVETRTIRRQLDGELHEETAEWFWATSLSSQKAPTRMVVRLGHRRWSIENQGFNELANAWHANHLYKHDPNALIVCYLLLFLAYNLFHALLTLQLKPALRRRTPACLLARLIAADFYAAAAGSVPSRSP